MSSRALARLGIDVPDLDRRRPAPERPAAARRAAGSSSLLALLAYRSASQGPSAAGPARLVQRACAACEAEDERLVARAPAPSTSDEPDLGRGQAPSALVDEVVGSGRGRPLDPATRAELEGSFGHDFGHVRVHTDSRASASAHALRALAYTTGRDIVFREGQFSPGTASGKRLLAHELAHVVQQQASGAARPAGFTVAGRDSPGERAADAAADAVLRGDPVAPAGQAAAGPGASVHRAPEAGAPPPAFGQQPADLNASCAGWERDDDSFAIKVAQHHVRARLHRTPALVTTPGCSRFSGSSSLSCFVKFADGLEVNVARSRSGQVTAGIVGSAGDLCVYTYTCEASGRLALTLKECL